VGKAGSPREVQRLRRHLRREPRRELDSRERGLRFLREVRESLSREGGGNVTGRPGLMPEGFFDLVSASGLYGHERPSATGPSTATHVHACPDCKRRVPCGMECPGVSELLDGATMLPMCPIRTCRDCAERNGAEVRGLAESTIAPLAHEQLTPEWFDKYNGVTR
jgi:hypothetical protein